VTPKKQSRQKSEALSESFVGDDVGLKPATPCGGEVLRFMFQISHAKHPM